ncbi:hypothetical protein Harman_31080 [Haloarcula mannanilytica]|uniref:Uncharacterized protein n=1 Tax=Haloarcula mannanilytica TaxID=2509225 RepID=A0A4C2ERF1_9EURY|nr:hypothetical protein [Haloarcula mannanilytica]GCF15173.1 hypothetical protein Harman_31080 [Haloarcula mannanilytica]
MDLEISRELLSEEAAAFALYGKQFVGGLGRQVCILLSGSAASTVDDQHGPVGQVIHIPDQRTRLSGPA